MDILTHAITGAITFTVGVLLPFVLKLRQQGTAEWQAIVEDLRKRIVNLEGYAEALRSEHVECLKVQYELRGRIAAMESVAGQCFKPAPVKPDESATVSASIPSMPYPLEP